MDTARRVEQTPDVQKARPRAYAFGPFVVDRVKRVLRQGTDVVPLTSKAFDVLLFLIDHRDRAVAKDEILNAVWGDRIVEENNLFRQISRIRKALNERPGEHRYLVTLPNHGYGFVGDVTELYTVPEPNGIDRAPAPQPVPEGAPAPVPEPAAPAAAPDKVAADETNAPPRRRAALIYVAVAAAAVIALGAVAAWGFRAQQESGPSHPPPVLRQLTFDPGFPREGSWSPDETALAFVSDRAGNPDIWIQNIRDQSVTQLTRATSAETSPAWSPDGQWIAYVSTQDGGGIFVARADGTEERKISSFGQHPQWSPDGKSLLFTSRAGGVLGLLSVYTVGLEEFVPQLVRPDVTESIEPAAAAWHPDGRISVFGTTEGEPILLTFEAHGGAPVATLTSPEWRERARELGLQLGAFVWSVSGRQLFFEGMAGGVQDLWSISVDPATLRERGGPERLTAGPSAEGQPFVGRAGEWVGFDIRVAQTRLFAFDFDAASGKLLSAGRPLTSGVTGEFDPNLAADGKRFSYSINRGGYYEAWEYDLETGRERMIFKDAGGVFGKPRQSPDGKHILISKRTNENGRERTELLVLAPGSGVVRTVFVENSPSFTPSDWTNRDGIVLGACRPVPTQPPSLCQVSLAGDRTSTEATLIASDPTRELWNGRASPDGRWIAFQVLDRALNGSSTLFVMPISGGPWIQISDGNSFDDKPRWAAGGRMLYFVSNRGGAKNVWGRRFDPATGTPVGPAFQVTSFVSDLRTIAPQLVEMDMAVSNDRLLLPITESTSQLWELQHAPEN